MATYHVRRVVITVFLTVVAACSPPPAPSETTFLVQTPIVVDAGHGVPVYTVHLDRVAFQIAGLAKRVTTVTDPVYKQTATYETVSLVDLLTAIKPAAVASLDNMRLVFQASDGYRSVTTVNIAKGLNARLAIRDLRAEPGQRWRLIPGKPTAVTPAPYYLVWQSSDPDLPWPYGITDVEVWMTEPADLSDPGSNERAKTGYVMFKKHCQSCHSVNGVGGAFGPELNLPASVTEYWNPAALKQFILNPASIRRNAKMPTLTDLSESDVEAIISYLKQMKTLKRVARTEAQLP